jgi:hypothetical protein
MEVYTPPAKPVKPADYDEFLKSLTPVEKRLHELAEVKLGSSYFVQWSHGYVSWKASQKK